MACPCFIEDYVGFCGGSDVPYVPSIDEMEQFCFTDRCTTCMLFKNSELRDGSVKRKYSRANIGSFISAGRYTEGSKSPANHVATR